MNQFELLKTLVRETRLSTSIAGDLAAKAQLQPQGLPLLEVKQSLAYLSQHLNAALIAAASLKAQAKEEEAKLIQHN